MPKGALTESRELGSESYTLLLMDVLAEGPDRQAPDGENELDIVQAADALTEVVWLEKSVSPACRLGRTQQAGVFSPPSLGVADPRCRPLGQGEYTVSEERAA